MRTSKSSSPGNHDLHAKAIQALLEAEDMPAGSARVEALKKASQLCNAADTYNYLFSSELRRPE
jgi:hypothetical protein